MIPRQINLIGRRYVRLVVRVLHLRSNVIQRVHVAGDIDKSTNESRRLVELKSNACCYCVTWSIWRFVFSLRKSYTHYCVVPKNRITNCLSIILSSYFCTSENNNNGLRGSSKRCNIITLFVYFVIIACDNILRHLL